MNILVFDIETIPDVAAGRKLYNLTDLSDEEVVLAMLALRRKKVGHDFLPHYLQKIVVISLVLQQQDQIKLWSLGNNCASEAELIQRFFSGLEKYIPILVTWNGCGFDLPVLHYRSLLNSISAPIYWENGGERSDFRWNNYLNRFHYRHLDLMDVLAGYQNKAFAPLDEIALMLGFPGKMVMHGSEVWRQYLAGNLQGINNYCEIDVLNTYCVYLRFELMRGVINRAKYDQLMINLRVYLEERKEQHFIEFLENL